MEGDKGAVRFVTSSYGSKVRVSCAANNRLASRLHADGNYRRMGDGALER